MHLSKSFARKLAVITGMVIAVMLLVAPVAAADVDVTPLPPGPDVYTYAGNPDAPDFQSAGFNVDECVRVETPRGNSQTTLFEVNGEPVIVYYHVTNGGSTMTWQSEYELALVNMKGGNVQLDNPDLTFGNGNGGGQFYDYSGVTWDFSGVGNDDTPLYTDTVTTPNGQAISHVDFCWNYELLVEKSGVPSFERTFDWTITKQASNEEHLFAGDTADIEWTIIIDKSEPVDHDYMIEWTIEVTNPAPFAVSNISISDDQIANATSSTCDSLTSLAAGQTASCSYIVPYETGADQTNDVTVASPDIDAGTDSALVQFGDPSKVNNDSVIFSDLLDGTFENADDFVDKNITQDILDANLEADAIFNFDTTLTYTQNDVSCDAGDATFDNTARITSADGLDKSDDASASIDCETPSMSKDAFVDFTRTYNWTIDKTGTPDHELFVGESGQIDWDVLVTNTDFTDSDYVVRGEITFNNPHAGNRTLELSNIADFVSGGAGFSATVFECGNEANVLTSLDVIEASASVCYSVEADANSNSNKASAAYATYSFAADGTPTALGSQAIDTGDVAVQQGVITEVNTTVTIDDYYNGSETPSPLGTVTLGESPKNFDIVTTETCDATPGFIVTNRAEIRETGQDDSAEVTFTCYEVAIEKDAPGTFNTYYNWDIVKDFSDPGGFLSDGVIMLNHDQQPEFPTLDYSVSVFLDAVDGTIVNDWQVSGMITLTNPHPTRAAEITSLVDLVDAAGGGTIPTTLNVECAGAFEIPAGQSVVCTYETAVINSPNANPFGAENNVSASQTLYDFDFTETLIGVSSNSPATHTDSADVVLSEADAIDECAIVTDQWTITPSGTTGTDVLGIVCVDAEAAAAVENPMSYPVSVAPDTFNYQVTFDPANFECGPNVYHNTATVTELDTDQFDNDSENVNVDKRCDVGCTLTPGYWKTHAPEPFLVAARSDDAWVSPLDMPAALGIPGVTGPEMAFPAGILTQWIYTEGKGRHAVETPVNYLTAMTIPPQGNEWFILSNAFAAAHLNIQNGAGYSAIDAEFQQAYQLLLTYGPNEVADAKGQTLVDERAQMVALAATLDDYNNGIIGPGHCDDPNAGN